MTRRPLKTERGRGLHLYTEPGIGSWEEWQQLPYLDTTDPARRLQAESTPKLADIGGLYGNPDAQRANERRRRASEALERAGVRPRRGW